MLDLIEQLKRDEGVHLKPYRDSVGKLTIGIGRNLDDVGLYLDEVELLLARDLGRVKTAVLREWPWIANLGDARQGALLNMAFNMGIGGLAQFRNTLGMLQAGQFDAAADEMLKSHWASQVGDRAHRLAQQIRSGQWM